MRSNHTTRRDEGSILSMVLAFMVLAGMVVVAILGFASTVFRARPPIDVRNSTAETAESAIRMAITFQRDFGPAGCYNGGGTSPLPSSGEFNDMDIELSCTELPGIDNYTESARSRYGLITTSNSTLASEGGITGRATAGFPIKELSGNIYVNGGDFGPSVADIGIRAMAGSSYVAAPNTPVAERYLVSGAPTTPPDPPAVPAAVACDPTIPANPDGFPDFVSPIDGASVTHTMSCDPNPWWSVAGDVWSSARTYPVLPQLPSFLRSAIPNELYNGCQVLYPGRYSDDVVLDGNSGSGKYYLASGVYYFENPVRVVNGASVVGGEGNYTEGCLDADAAFDRYGVWSPKNHEITGRGVTLLLGDDANIEVVDSSLRLNRRISNPSTRGSEAISIRSVNFGPKGNVDIPADQVQVGEYPINATTNNPDPELREPGSTIAASAHSIVVANQTLQYQESTLTDSADVLTVRVTSASSGVPTFEADGYVFVPNAGLTLNTGAQSNYAMRFSGGVVAANLDLNIGALPSAGAGNFEFSASSKPIQRRVQLGAKVTASDGSVARSTALVQVHSNGSYAINSWGVDPEAGAPTTTVATTAPTTTVAGPTTTVAGPTTTVAGPTTTVEETTTTTTVAGPTTTTTTAPPVPTSGPCNVSSSSWTRNFGDGTWAAEFRNLSSNAPTSNPFGGTPTKTADVNEVYKANNNSGPMNGINADDFTARFTRSIETGTACSVKFRMGGDDGVRVFVNGTKVLDDWSNHAYRQDERTVSLPAGTNTIVFEFYERGGQAGYELVWRD